MAVWTTPLHDEAQVAWARSISATVLPWSLLGGGYGNYAAHDVQASRAQTMFGEDRWARLRQVMQTYDPTELLRYDANIAPSGALHGVALLAARSACSPEPRAHRCRRSRVTGVRSQWSPPGLPPDETRPRGFAASR